MQSVCWFVSLANLSLQKKKTAVTIKTIRTDKNFLLFAIL